MTNPLAQDLGGVVRLLEKATPGPYEASHPIEPGFGFGAWSTIAGDDEIVVAQCQFPADANAVAAAINFLRTHSAEIAGALRDAERLDYIERTFTGMSNGERYLPRVMGWGKSRNGRTLREACDKYMQRESAMQQGGGGGEAAA